MSDSASLGVPAEMAVEHITANAQHYFDVVKSHNRRGLLWLVFLIPNPEQSSRNWRQEAVSMKSISFLPLEAVQSSQSASLMKMYQTYDEASQFVCWYTLEAPDGTPLHSKVVVVDSTPPSPGLPEQATAGGMSAFREIPSIHDGSPVHPSSGGKGQDYTSLLRMTIEIADAAGKMSSAIDDLTSKVAKLTERVDLSDRGLTAMLQDDRCAVLEAKVSVLEGMLVKLMNGPTPASSSHDPPPAEPVSRTSSAQQPASAPASVSAGQIGARCLQPSVPLRPVSPRCPPVSPTHTRAPQGEAVLQAGLEQQQPRPHSSGGVGVGVGAAEPLPLHIGEERWRAAEAVDASHAAQGPQVSPRRLPGGAGVLPVPVPLQGGGAVQAAVPRSTLDDMIARFEAKLCTLGGVSDAGTAQP